MVGALKHLCIVECVEGGDDLPCELGTHHGVDRGRKAEVDVGVDGQREIEVRVDGPARGLDGGRSVAHDLHTTERA